MAVPFIDITSNLGDDFVVCLAFHALCLVLTLLRTPSTFINPSLGPNRLTDFGRLTNPRADLVAPLQSFSMRSRFHE